MDFRDECKEWLGPLGYTLHFHDGNHTSFTFTNSNELYSPSITCSIHNGEKRCSLHGGHRLKMLVTTNIQSMQFKHPHIQRFIAAMTHYELLCETHPPNISML